MKALCHIRGISTSSQETFDNPGSHLPFAHNGTKVMLLPRKQNFIHYILLPWTSLWTGKHWTLFFFFQGCANKKKWSDKWMCAFCSGPTTFLSDWGKPQLGCQLFKGSKIKCRCENVPTTAWNPFCIIFSIFFHDFLQLWICCCLHAARVAE